MKKRLLSEAIRQARMHARPAVIADIKMFSPREGVLLQVEHLPEYLTHLIAGGVDALSIVTAQQFGGTPEVARRVAESTDLPLMRKDYFYAVEQIDESLALGFTAVQLTLSMIEDMNVVASLKYRAEQLGLEVVLAVHTPEELSRALAMQAVIIGINNRSIQHLEMDGGTVSLTEKLASMVPSNVLLLSESGLTLPNDVARAWVAGADAVLVGSAFAKSADVRLTLKDFLSAHLAPVV